MDLDENILACFSQRPYILSHYFWLVYDREGSQLFDKLTEEEEYYLTRTESQIFESNADDIIAQAAINKDDRIRIVELGAGTATKTNILLAATLKRQEPPIDYRPIDISVTALNEGKSILEDLVPDACVTPQVANFLTDSLELLQFDGRTLLVYIGSAIGNFTPEEAIEILVHVRQQLQPGDAILIGVDLKKDPSIILRAYDDINGVNIHFNLHLLTRLNRDFGYNFNLDQFRYRTI